MRNVKPGLRYYNLRIRVEISVFATEKRSSHGGKGEGTAILLQAWTGP